MKTTPISLYDASLYCSPSGCLCADASAPKGVTDAFETGEVQGLVYLANQGLREELLPALAWARRWATRFITELCQLREPCKVGVPDEAIVVEMLNAAPPMRGGEYLEEGVLKRLWEDLKQWALGGVATNPGGFDAWLQTHCPAWQQVGRVTFHLAENKANPTTPFAFLATYTDQLSADGRVQHIPLIRALKENQNSQGTLEALLKPVRAAAERSAFLRELLETRRLFQALAWTPQDAYAFLCEVQCFEESGLVVKLPDWWRGRRAARPVVSVTLDAPVSGKVGLSSMLSFHIELTLGGAKLSADEMAQIRASAAGLVNLRGQWVEVDSRRLEQALEHWRRVEAAHQAGGLSFHEGMRWLAGFPQGGGVEELDASTIAGRSWSEVVAGKELEERLAQMCKPSPIDSIPGFQAKLRPYQLEGVGWLNFVSKMGLGACLADDMGLGKTLQVLALFCLRKESGMAGSPSLVVVPASLLGNWLGEARRYAPHLRTLVLHPSFISRETLEEIWDHPDKVLAEVDVVLTSYTLLQRHKGFEERVWDVVVLDEAQAVKNPATAQARSVKKLRSHARIALTGTPVENRLGDLWSLFDFLNPGLLGGAAVFSELTRRMSDTPEGFAPLRRCIAPYLLRRLKTDRKVIADLPEKIEMQTRCVLAKKQAILYGRLVEQLKADLASATEEPNQRRGLVLSYLTKFKQVCNHPSQWSGDGKFKADESGKFQSLVRIAEELAERQERCLVFTQFREMTEPIAALLAGVFGRGGLVLHGGTPVQQRQKMVDAFQRPDGPPFFVLSVKAGGTGLTLTAANHVVHFDRWWNPAVENQATDRAFRIGQKRNVLVHKFLTTGTIEERVDALLREKGALADDLLGGEAGAHRLLTEMNNEELLRFVRLDIESIAM